MREPEEPRPSFARPRPATSPLRACPPPRSYVPPGIAGRVDRFARPPLSAIAVNAAPTARVASGCPSGQRGRYVTRPATRAFCERCVFALTPFASIALRAWSPRPNLAPLAFALLSPPRDPPAPFAFPARVAACPLSRRPTTPPASPATRLWRGSSS